MRIATVYVDGNRQAAIIADGTAVPISEINSRLSCSFPLLLDELIHGGFITELKKTVERAAGTEWRGIPLHEAVFAAPFLTPPKIWGIGLNYARHAGDLQARHPIDEPASFMKPSTSIIGPGDPVLLPSQSQRVTGEAEIGVIIGKKCRHVDIKDVPDVLLGYTTIIDMTAEDILRKNPRFLTRSKSFDTFFSFGPQIVTADEITDVNSLTITTWKNGREHRSGIVGNMTFPPFELVSFHSRVMTLMPGDIISCGTPGAVPIEDGDTIGCTVSTIGRLQNPVLNAPEHA